MARCINSKYLYPNENSSYWTRWTNSTHNRAICQPTPQQPHLLALKLPMAQLGAPLSVNKKIFYLLSGIGGTTHTQGEQKEAQRWLLLLVIWHFFISPQLGFLGPTLALTSQFKQFCARDHLYQVEGVQHAQFFLLQCLIDDQIGMKATFLFELGFNKRNTQREAKERK